MLELLQYPDQISTWRQHCGISVTVADAECDDQSTYSTAALHWMLSVLCCQSGCATLCSSNIFTQTTGPCTGIDDIPHNAQHFLITILGPLLKLVEWKQKFTQCKNQGDGTGPADRCCQDLRVKYGIISEASKIMLPLMTQYCQTHTLTAAFRLLLGALSLTASRSTHSALRNHHIHLTHLLFDFSIAKQHHKCDENSWANTYPKTGATPTRQPKMGQDKTVLGQLGQIMYPKTHHATLTRCLKTRCCEVL